MIGTSEPMQRVYQQIERAARSDATVLIQGESGTGKGLVALAIHRNSPRAAGRFLEFNCASIPAMLHETELFGNVRSAFSGAHREYAGCFERVHGGALLLSEIGALSLQVQAAVERALVARKIRRVGGEREIPVDVRLLAATTKDLSKRVEQGRFRQGLYSRLDEIHILVPSLRERREDIPALVEHFLARMCKAFELSPRHLAPGSLELLTDHDWPGNVRELEDVVTRMALYAGDTVIDVPVVLAALRRRSDYPTQRSDVTFEECRDAHDRRFIEDVLRAHDYRLQETALELGIGRVSLRERMKQLGIRTGS